jgi:hypothetical protein
MGGGGKDGGNVHAIYRVLWVLLGRITTCSAAGGEKDRERRRRKGGTDSKGYAGERRQRLSDPNPGSAGYSASLICINTVRNASPIMLSSNPIHNYCDHTQLMMQCCKLENPKLLI